MSFHFHPILTIKHINYTNVFFLLGRLTVQISLLTHDLSLACYPGATVLFPFVKAGTSVALSAAEKGPKRVLK